MKKYNTIRKAYALVAKHKATDIMFGWALRKAMRWYK